ncbi:MAG: DNA double-strand break repair nuclease NurA [Candidatus Aenigmarchaeota archaeon]|nr:DNA double-strand break repair nuclease NurA [Candidatus Aenigmarchaeota archaeon]
MGADITSDIDAITADLVGWDKKILSVAKILRDKNKSSDSGGCGNFLEDNLSVKVEPDNSSNLIVGGIDGGLLQKEYHGVNIIITRAVCAVFKYKDRKLSDSDYYPSAFPSPKIKVVKSSFDPSSFSSVASIFRLEGELGLACDMLSTQNDMDLLFLDGSLTLHPSVLGGVGPIKKGYEDLVGTVKRMYLLALEKKTILSGIVEDSRSQAFIKNCRSMLDVDDVKSLENVKDTHLLTYLLSVGERTSVFRTVDDNGGVSSEVKGFENNLFSFYIRTSEFDRALRVDFVAKENPVAVASKIASSIFSMSRHNSAYGIPPVIIDADQRAKLSGDELMSVENEIKRGAGRLASFSELRRNSRPV